jgi:hypothetical protein
MRDSAAKAQTDVSGFTEVKGPTSRFMHYVEGARRLRSISVTGWDEMIWEVPETSSLLSKRAHEPKARTLIFSSLETSKTRGLANRKPMGTPFVDVVKAMVRYRASQKAQLITNLRRLIDVARHLDKALRDAGASEFGLLSLRHFEIAEDSIKQSLAASTAYRACNYLATIAVEIDASRLTSRLIGYRNRLRRPPIGDQLDEESQKLGLAKMPSNRALEALADISNDPADDNERILLRHVDILVATGFRIGECLTLPVDCWVEEVATTKEAGSASATRCGIRYWPEKGGDPIVKWLPSSATPLARRAVAELQELCAPARRSALWREQNPGRLECFTGLAPGATLSINAIARLLGVTRDAVDLMLRSCRLEPVTKAGSTQLFLVEKVEHALARRRFDQVLVIRPNGVRQPLSQSLSVAFVNQFHSWKATLLWLPTPIRLCQIQVLLGASDAQAPTRSSAFSRRGITDEKGNRLRIRTHAFRHWLNTLANRGGLSDVELARWMGRRDLKQNEAYKHGTVEQRTRWAREMIDKGALAGPVARVAHALPADERDKFLDAAVEAVHFTPYGVCVHNFAASPCEYHLACFRGCPDYLRLKGNTEERHALHRLREDTLVTLKKARSAEGDRSGWARHAEETLRGLDAALAIDDEATAQDGTHVSVFSSRRETEKG